VVDPDDMIRKYGADALRLYVMFVAPPEKEVEWSDAGLEGAFRFLMRVWRLVQVWRPALGGAAPAPIAPSGLNQAERAIRRKTHDTIRRVTHDLDPRVHLNTAVSALMELVNDLYQFSDEHTRTGSPGRKATDAPAVERPETLAVLREAVDALVLMLAPFTPHMAEELWSELGHGSGLVHAAWPSFDPDVARGDEVVVPVQVNGKVRGRVAVPVDATDEEIQARALAEPSVLQHVQGRTVRKVIVAKGRLVSLVVQ
jgi:leucyl-tRNA synthetase